MVTFLKLLPQAQQQQQIAPHLIRRSNQQLRSRMEATRKQIMKTPMMSFMTISGLNLRVCTLRSSKGWNCRHMAWFLGSNLAITSFHEQSYLSVLEHSNYNSIRRSYLSCDTWEHESVCVCIEKYSHGVASRIQTCKKR